MIKGFRVFAFAMSALFLMAACRSSYTSSIDDIARPECNFRTGKLSRPYCRASIYELIASPSRYFGRDIYTVGYIEKGPGGSLGLAPSPDSFYANDTIGCFEVTELTVAEGVPEKMMMRNGIYAVHIAGNLQAPKLGLCSGQLTNAIVVAVSAMKPESEGAK